MPYINKASERFQNGEINDFKQAMRAYVEQFREDGCCLRQSGASAQEMMEHTLSLEEIKSGVAEALQIYNKVIQPAMKLAAEKMRQSSNPFVQEFADPLEDGDYSGLAL